jgi:hypothetical protein
VKEPKLDFKQDIGSMDPAQAHDAWEEMTNLDTQGLKDLKQSKRNQIYLDKAKGNQTEDNPPLKGGPLEDALTLAQTPRGEWTRKHREEAEEARNFLARSFPQFQQSEGEALVEEKPKIHKGEISLMRWGFDPAPEDGFP